MTPNFSTKILVSTLKARVTDLFNYNTLIKDAVYANVVGKVGNSIFHADSGNYNSTSDIVIGTNTSVDIDLPTSDGNILNGVYTFIENVKVINEVLYNPSVGSGYYAVTAPIANNFTSITLTSPPGTFQDDILLLMATLSDVRVGFYNSSNVLLASATIDTVSDDSVGFAAVNLASFATIAKIRIIGSNIYSTTKSYSYSGCPVVTPKLQAPADCYRSQMTVTDCTVYSAGTTLARTLTIQYPTLADGSHVLPTVTTSDASVTLGPNIWTGGYTIDLSSVLTWQQTDTLYIENTVTAQITPTVTCNNGLCALSACIAKFANKYLAAIANGSRDMGAIEQANIVIGMYISRIQLAVECENTTDAAALTTALSVYMKEGTATEGCDCGCSDNTTNSTPTEIFPLFSTPSTDGRLVVYSSAIPYPVMQQVYFEGQTFLVLTATLAGENPISNRSKFKWIGGGAYAGNTVANVAGSDTVTLNHNSGIATFTGFTPVAPADFGGFIINNTTITAGSDVEVEIRNQADGFAIISKIDIGSNNIVCTLQNNNPTDDLTSFVVLFNNKR